MTKFFTSVAGILFGLMALIHLYRHFYQFPVRVGEFDVPQAVSLPAFFILGILSFFMFRAANELGRRR